MLASAYIGRASTKSDLGNNEGAIEDCNTAIALKPENTVLAVTYIVRGKAKSSKGDKKDGIIDYDKAIQLEPNYAEFYYHRGVANAAMKRTSEAETDFKTALKLLEQVVSVSKSVNKKIGPSGLSFYLSVRPDLKDDIEKALRELE